MIVNCANKLRKAKTAKDVTLKLNDTVFSLGYRNLKAIGSI